MGGVDSELKESALELLFIKFTSKDQTLIPAWVLTESTIVLQFYLQAAASAADSSSIRLIYESINWWCLGDIQKLAGLEVSMSCGAPCKATDGNLWRASGGPIGNLWSFEGSIWRFDSIAVVKPFANFSSKY